MKYAFAAIALAAVASAQSLADIPKCAIPCLDESISKNTDCETTDLACVCKNFKEVQGDATSCVIEKCGSDVAISMFSLHPPRYPRGLPHVYDIYTCMIQS